VIGAIDDIPLLVSSLRVDRVVVSLSDARGKLPMDKLLDIRLGSGVTFDHLATVYEEYTGKIAVENLRPSWLIFSEGFRKTRLLLAAKRVLDIVAAAVGLLISTPLMLLIAAAVRCSSRGPVFYHQQRVGRHGGVFIVHKFRTMKIDAEAHTGPVWSQANDTRVTPIGRFLRRSRLDELPQLWNVLIGEMSFVGPRPERPEFVEKLTESIPYYGQRHVIKPGITGWAQVRYTYGASVEDAIEKAPVRSVLHQESLDCAGPRDHFRDDQDGHSAPRRSMTSRSADSRIVNAMTIDVEDYFQVSAFDTIVSRAGWDQFDSRISRNTDCASNSSIRRACGVPSSSSAGSPRNSRSGAPHCRRRPRSGVTRLPPPAPVHADAEAVQGGCPRGKDDD